jgi:ribosome-associated protein
VYGQFALDTRMKQRGNRPLAIEGLQGTGWVLLDYGDVVAHVFTDESRCYYNLERLWGDGKPVAWEVKGKTGTGRKKTD